MRTLGTCIAEAVLRRRDRKFADSALEEAGFEPSVPRELMSPSLDSPLTEKSARTRTDIRTTTGAFRGSDGSSPLPSTGESTDRKEFWTRRWDPL